MLGSGYARAMPPLTHLALAVRDEDASRRFYEYYFDFEVAYRAEDGTLLMRNADGFSLALGRWESDAKLPSFLHFGFRGRSPEDVREWAERFRSEGVEIVEEWDGPDYVSVKVREPSGYVVELSWDEAFR
jgi:catechol 2,3-dioxygenase-like lactoylglutathione lyase family enzyme